MDDRYQQRRAVIDAVFDNAPPDPKSRTVSVSPSARYRLEVVQYVPARGWRYTRGKVVRIADGALIADVKRNYSHFWHSWIQHANDCEYLLCGEDYQGQTVINLSNAETRTSFEQGAHNGAGFCWASAYPSPDSKLLAVEGCYWACPYELVVFDFTNPDELPYREIARFPDPWEWKEWLDNHTFEYISNVDVRKSDGVPFDDLPEEEKAPLEDDWSLLETRKEIRRFSV
jgi:hypothetical protein